MNLSFDDILQAEIRIKDHVVQTPTITNETLNQKLGAKIYFKCENLQTTGSFKLRGAANKILNYFEQHKKMPDKIVAVSSGNHAQAVAFLAKKFGIKTIIYMEEKASAYKINSTKKYGGEMVEVILTKTKKETEIYAEEKVAEGYLYVHSSNDQDIATGQGTACLEALQEISKTNQDPFDAVFAPCGGGGLITGTYLACQNLKPLPKIFAAEPLTGNDGAISFRSGTIYSFNETPVTIADGAKTLKISASNFPYIQKLDGIYEISEEDIIGWAKVLNQTLELAIEPTSALAMAAAAQFIAAEKQKNPHHQPKVLAILSGGNMSDETVEIINRHNH